MLNLLKILDLYFAEILIDSPEDKAQYCLPLLVTESISNKYVTESTLIST